MNSENKITKDELIAQGTQASVLIPEAMCECGENTSGGITDEDKAALEAQLEDKADKAEVIAGLDKKVDKVDGKGLSTNDFTNVDKQKLDSLENFDDTQLTSAITNIEKSLDEKADKHLVYTKEEINGIRDVINNSLNALNTNKADKEEVYAKDDTLSKEQVFTMLADKVDKVDGKGLSSNDFTDEDKAKLDKFEFVLTNDDEIEDGLHQIASSEDYRSKLKENGYVVYHDVKYKVKDCGVTSDSFPWIVTEGAIITANEDGELSDHTQKNIARSVYIWFDTILHYQPYGSIIPSKVSELTNDLKYPTETQVENRLAILYESLDSQLVDEYTHLDNKKVDKVTGKGLSTNDYTTDDKDKLGALPTNAELTTTLATKADNATVNTELAKKVDKVSGKQLSTEDFTAALKEKLNGLTNYDDTALDAKIEALKSRLDTLVGSGDVTAVIDTFQEIESFLQGVTNTQTLTGLLQEMKSEIIALIPTDYFKCDNYNNIDIDIDTVVKGGVYRVGGAKTSNLPSSSYQYGQLVVIRGGAVDTIAQMLFSYMPNVPIIVRQGNPIAVGGAGSWGNWRKLIEANGTSSQFLKADGSVDSTEYFPKSGGKINGTTAQPITLDTTYENNCIIKYLQSGIDKVYSGYSKANGAVLYNYTCDCFLGIKDDGTPHFNGSTLWHEGNDGADSGLDADLLDGKQGSSYFTKLTTANADELTGTDPIGSYEINRDNIGYVITNAPFNYGGLFHIGNKVSSCQFAYSSNNSLKFRARWNYPEGTPWLSWREIAFTDSNVGSADKLTTHQLTNEDLDTLKEVGKIYYAGTNTCLNKPNNVANGFNLAVIQNDSTNRFQLLIDVKGNIYKRYYDSVNKVWSSWQQLATTDGAVAKLTTKQLTNENLNDIKSVELCVYFAAYGHSVTNVPTGVGLKGFTLQVYGRGLADLVQVLTVIETNTTYKRTLSGGTWSPWKKMLTEDDIASLVSRIEALENAIVNNA